MSRLLTLAALMVFILVVVLRWIPRIRGGSDPRMQRPHERDVVICADCGTKYNPNTTGWICPKCKK